jgi:hypothetical protein
MSPAVDDGLGSDHDGDATLMAVEAEVHRYLAALSSLTASEIDLVRAVSSALGSGASAEEICRRLTAIDVEVDQLPTALRAALGFPSG